MKALSKINPKLLLLGLLAAPAPASAISLFEQAFNIDGTVSNITSGDPVPAGMSLAGFDSTTGLGNIQYSVGGGGLHYFSLFVDHEIDESVNTFFNELGSSNGTPGSGQTWEVDEPGWVFGDVYQNFLNGSLDGTVGTAFADDVSMAMGWAFSLAAGQTATINVLLSDVAPGSGFYLQHTDPDSGVSVYLSGDLRVTAPPPAGVPETGSTLALLATATFGLASMARRMRTK